MNEAGGMLPFIVHCFRSQSYPSSLAPHPCYLCFFTGVFAGVFGGAVFFAVCVFVSAAPSPSERLSSTSTVCVTASVPLTAGCAAAGAIVWVVGAVDVSADFPQRQPDSDNINIINVNTDSVAALFTDTSSMDTDPMQFP
ncbi:MAG: hypothetical protein QOK37_3295 [Thermoanaerobaculia bacterium]|nr:hypothetical protein [Thermoanaerobaculia bacterium]